MRIFLGILLLLSWGTVCFAAFQYSLTPVESDTPTPFGRAYALSVSSGAGSIYISDTSPSNPLFTSNVKVKSNNYGYVDLEKGKLVKGDPKDTIKLADGRTAYKLGDFKEGDVVGIWVKTNRGRGVSVMDIFNNPLLIYRDIESYNIGRMIFAGNTHVSFLLTGVDKEAPRGQPLPGVLAALAVAGGGVLYCVYSSKKTKQNKDKTD